MSDKRYFHFTLGPVQGFVSQARRTRDFWAGSFILSWLSGVAMQATISEGGKILFPQINEEYLSWIKGKPQGKAPRQGSIPNRFKAEVNADFTTDQAQQIVKSIQSAWKALADSVYLNDIKGYENSETRAIWNRQIESFWDISWVITDDENDSSALNRRKNWRSYQPPEEGGVKCMMMDGWQELSGVESPHKGNMNEFWVSIRNNNSKAMQSDLNKGESLCAIAFVKRRFVHYFDSISVEEMPGKWTLKGWQIKSGMPSVSYLASIHWLEKQMIAAKADSKIKTRLMNFQDEAYTLTKERGEWESNIKCLHQQIDDPKSKRWASFDGNVYFENVLLNKKLYPDEAQARKVAKALTRLGSSPTPFYAVLMMDGDNLGQNMSILENQEVISKALGSFIRGIEGEKGIVHNNNGFLIYAGGDDVLAVLPLEDAIKCATEIRAFYAKCFAGEKIATTLSAAIEFAHIKMPLTKVLHDAHDLLDKIAKEKIGRDALAIRVWKPGGAAIEWAQPWETALESDNSQTVVESLVANFQDIDAKKDSTFSNKFFYKIRDRFTLLNPSEKKPDKPILTPDQAKSLMAMEYLNSSTVVSKELTMEEAEIIITPLLKQCRPHYRYKIDDKEFDIKSSEFLQADGALLLRFLAQKGELS